MLSICWRNSLSLFAFRFPRREDYEVVQVVQLDETNEEKLARLLETIEVSQYNIKEVVDKVGNEQHSNYQGPNCLKR